VRGPLVVLGDALLDVDLVGRASRLSPDAPVPVVEDLVAHPRPGGAALAATMAARDGHEVVLVTALGDDEAGAQVEDLLHGIRLLRLPHDGQTPVKQRVRAAGQSLLRLDSGGARGRTGGLTPAARGALLSGGAVLVADYGRGVVDAAGVREVLGGLTGRVPVVWDPHPRGGAPVPGARLVTPNRAEAELFAQRLGGVDDTREVRACGDHAGRTGHGLTVDGGLARVRRHADALVDAWRAHAVAVTMGERGALLSYGEGTPVMTPAPSVPCPDPCGAGDRFAVSAALSLGAGRVTIEAVQDAVAAAAAYVSAGGPASLSSAGAGPDRTRPESVVDRVRREGGVVVATGGCFDLLHAGHVATLRAARRLGDCLVVCLNSDASVRRLKGPSRPLVPAADRARVLEALECVDDVVVFEEDTPVEVLRGIRPQVWAKGGDYGGRKVPEALVLQEWGGQAVVLPYLQGRSTTDLVRTAVATQALGAADTGRNS
jgi:D-beta-D-heptose 7-phosphate kinase/D-beta-D-heptose 1-phosphate adenosyltransferase